MMTTTTCHLPSAAPAVRRFSGRRGLNRTSARSTLSGWHPSSMPLCRCDRLRSIDAKRFPAKGEEQITILLRTVFESSNGATALTSPILRAVSICMLPQWVDRGLEWIEAFDRIDLVGLRATLSELGLEDQLDRVLRRKLEEILGAPKAAAIQKKPPARPKAARPPMVSESVWSEVTALRKKLKRPKAARMAA